MTQTHTGYEAWRPKAGDLVLVHGASAVGVLAQRHDDLRFRPDHMAAFLELLESAVLYDRLVAGVSGFGTPLAAKGPMHEWFPLFRLRAISPSEDLEKYILDRLRDNGVLVERDVEIPGLPARDLLERQLQLFPSLRKYCEGIQSHGVASHWPIEEEKREIALMLTWSHNARGLYVAEAARRAGRPYHANRLETDAIAKSERDEHKVFASVVAHLHDRVNKASSRELQRVVALGGRTHFPETPIAWQILSRATRADELFAATMELRREYAPFRKYTQKLDAELRSEDTSVARQVRILEEIEAVTNDLWPAERKGFRRSVIDSVSFVAGLPTVALGSIPAAASLASTILSRPIDALIAGMRRRRYRVLFRSRRMFLRSKGATKRLATLLEVNEEVIRRGLSSESADESKWWKDLGSSLSKQ